MELRPNFSPPGSFPTSALTAPLLSSHNTCTDPLTAFLLWQIFLSRSISPASSTCSLSPRTGRKTGGEKCEQKMEGPPASPPIGMGPMCRPLTHTRLQGAADLEERRGAGASHALPSRTSAWSRKDFTTKVWALRASGLPSPAALCCRKAASGAGLGLLPFRTQDSKRPRHSCPSFQGQEELEESDALDGQE